MGDGSTFREMENFGQSSFAADAEGMLGNTIVSITAPTAEPKWQEMMNDEQIRWDK
jgi:hypothetical protein